MKTNIVVLLALFIKNLGGSEGKKMARNSSKITYCTLVMVIALAISHSTAMAQGSPIEPLGFGIEGTWDLETSFVDCTTDEPLSPPGRSLVSYVQGGTLIEEASGTPPSRRYPGLGVWQHVRAHTYAYAFKIFQYNADGTSNGKIVVIGETEYNLDDTTTSSASARIYNAAGALIVSRCVITFGTRFTGEQ
ncbi:MAG TPA: hypothetical protein VI566_07855 [Xanthomonadales bacterium]|nr:hypothetical protein [Xanthomonadales bacterium]